MSLVATYSRLTPFAIPEMTEVEPEDLRDRDFLFQLRDLLRIAATFLWD